jgi:hypothetical protein
MAHEVSGEWVEVKTVAIGEVVGTGDADEVRTRELSYSSSVNYLEKGREMINYNEFHSFLQYWTPMINN